MPGSDDQYDQVHTYSQDHAGKSKTTKPAVREIGRDGAPVRLFVGDERDETAVRTPPSGVVYTFINQSGNPRVIDSTGTVSSPVDGQAIAPDSIAGVDIVGPDATRSDLQAAIDNASTGDAIIAEGDLSVSSPLTIDKRLTITIYGDIDASADAFHIGHNSAADGLELRIHGNIRGQGNSDGNTALNIEECREGVFEWDTIGGDSNNSGNGIQRGIYLHAAAAGAGPVDSNFYGRKIRDVTTAIDIHAENDLVQGHTFHDFPVFDTEVSVKVRGSDSADLNSFFGVTLHGHTAARNTDEVDETAAGIGNTYLLDFVGAAYPSKYTTLNGTLVSAPDGELLIGDRVIQGRTPGNDVITIDASDNVDLNDRELFNVNIFKGTADADVELDVPVSSALSSGTAVGNALTIDGTRLVEAAAESDGAGGIQNASVDIRDAGGAAVYTNDVNGNHNMRGGDIYNIGFLKGIDIESSAPAAGDLATGEMRFGDGTGPNSRDEIFWSVDGSTVARVEADSIIT